MLATVVGIHGICRCRPKAVLCLALFIMIHCFFYIIVLSQDGTVDYTVWAYFIMLGPSSITFIMVFALYRKVCVYISLYIVYRKENKLYCLQMTNSANFIDPGREYMAEPPQYTEPMNIPLTQQHQNENYHSNVSVMNEDIYEWLNQIGLPQYYNLFIKHGIEDIDTIKTLTKQDLINIDIKKLGHRNKIMSNIQNQT